MPKTSWFLPSTPVFQRKLADWLQRRYASVSSLRNAWALDRPPASWTEDSSLVPLGSGLPDTSGASQLYLVSLPGSRLRADLNSGLAETLSQVYAARAAAMEGLLGLHKK